ncbi:MAG: histidine kinase dimerization/phospho-acceptor domain-containing protein, partial [Kofleriaceae bacterium]
MRRLLLVNALIFAVLAAVGVFAYFGWTSSSAVTIKDEKVQLLKELATEKVLNIEASLVGGDTRILNEIRLDQLDKLEDQVKSSGVAVASGFVLDDQLKPVVGGSWAGSREPKDALAMRDWYLANVMSKLTGLKRAELDTRYHKYGRGPFNRPYLLSYARKLLDGQIYYVVVEDDLNHLIFSTFPQFFSASHYLYQVVSEDKVVQYGIPFTYESDTLAAEIAFTETLDDWNLRITEKDDTAQIALRRKRVVDSMLLGGAVLIIVVGLILLAIAIRRERRSNELKSEFISNVSHELKTPLSIISMFGEMLAEGRTKSPEQAHEYAEIIWRESVRLGRL